MPRLLRQCFYLQEDGQDYEKEKTVSGRGSANVPNQRSSFDNFDHFFKSKKNLKFLR